MKHFRKRYRRPKQRSSSTKLHKNVLHDGKQHFCYLLRSTNSSCKNVYNGYTVNPARRLKQHSDALSKYPEVFPRSGSLQMVRKFKLFKTSPLEMYAIITGFPSLIHSLQFEWRVKYPSGRPRSKRKNEWKTPLGWVRGLLHILHEKQWTRSTPDLNHNHPLRLYLAPDIFEKINHEIETKSLLSLPNYVTCRLLPKNFKPSIK